MFILKQVENLRVHLVFSVNLYLNKSGVEISLVSDFIYSFLSEHEGPVTTVNISSDGVKILAATSTVSRCTC